jgi:hypothetical protein
LPSTKHSGPKRGLKLSKRGKIIVGAGGAAVAIVALSAILALAGKGPKPLQDLGNKITGHKSEPAPQICPLTGAEQKTVPSRPALAIKVENLPEARPQAGLNKADIVYEEPVEGGITRFIVLFQCQDSDRVGPVRSGRLTDAPVLVQYGKPVFGYAGGVPQVIQSVKDHGIRDENFNIAPGAYHLDPARSMPHNTYTSTKELYTAAHNPNDPPDPVFQYSEDQPEKAKKAAFAHLDFSGTADVYWRWDGKDGIWMRSHGTEPHMLEGDVQVSAKNIVVQIVQIKYTGIYDVAGSPSPEAITTGSGKAYVFRGGKVIVGTWVRQGEDDVTRLLAKGGDEIKLAPGRTWIELYPDDRPEIEIGKTPAA